MPIVFSDGRKDGRTMARSIGLRETPTYLNSAQIPGTVLLELIAT
jgi:hypothetical protein